MSRCFGEKGDDNRENADGVKCDGYTVEESEVADTKGVDETSEYEKTSTDADFFGDRDFESVQRSQSRYECRTTVNDSCTDCRLTQEVEVSGSVGGEWRVGRSCDKCCPTVAKIRIDELLLISEGERGADVLIRSSTRRYRRYTMKA